MRTDRGAAGRHAGVGLALSMILALHACAAPGSTAKNPFDGMRGLKQIQIEVLNNNWNDATLHALRGGERHRLGVVHGKGEALYRMEWPMSLPLRIEIDLLAAGSCVTRELLVDPGDRVELQIESDLSLDPDCRRMR